MCFIQTRKTNEKKKNQSKTGQDIIHKSTQKRAYVAIKIKSVVMEHFEKGVRMCE